MTPADRVATTAGRQRLEDLFRAHEPMVHAYIRRRIAVDVVEDLVAETFLVAWRRIEDVPADPLPWLLAVARRVLSTYRRGDQRRHNLGERLKNTEPRVSVSPQEEGEDRAIASLARLSERDREALALIAWEGLTPAQAATVLGEPAVRFRVRLHRATRRMKTLLAEPGAASGAPSTTPMPSPRPGGLR